MEMREEAHKWTFCDLGEKWLVKFHEGVFGRGGIEDEPLIESVSHHYREALHRADVMYVSADMQEVIHQAAVDIPNDLEFHDHNLLCNTGFCIFNESIIGEDISGGTVVFKGILWHKTIIGVVSKEDGQTYRSPAILLWLLSDTQDLRDDFTSFLARMNSSEKFKQINQPVPSRLLPGHLLIVPMDVPYLADWPTSAGAGITEALTRTFIAINLVAQQNIAETAKMRTPRATRRRWNLDNNSVITLITLRRKKMALPDDHTPQKVEWSRRWIVRGFWRNQYYPKTKTHDWLYIHEYIKGPEDKPLVITERRVFDFRR